MVSYAAPGRRRRSARRFLRRVPAPGRGPAALARRAASAISRSSPGCRSRSSSASGRNASGCSIPATCSTCRRRSRTTAYAVDACMTYSIGFRAPSAQELATAFLDWLRDRIALDGRYADPGLAASARTGAHRRDGAALRRRDALPRSLERTRRSRAFSASYLTEPKSIVTLRAAGASASPGFIQSRARRGAACAWTAARSCSTMSGISSSTATRCGGLRSTSGRAEDASPTSGISRARSVRRSAPLVHPVPIGTAMATSTSIESPVPSRASPSLRDLGRGADRGDRRADRTGAAADPRFRSGSLADRLEPGRAHRSAVRVPARDARPTARHHRARHALSRNARARAC